MRIAILSLLWVGCGAGNALAANPESPAPGRVVAEANAVLDDWHAAAADADEERYFGHFTTDGVFLGTDASERWDVGAFRDYSHPFFARGRAWSFRATRREVIVRAGGDIVWFDEDLHTENRGPARGSGVLQRSADGQLRIAHYNLAITIPNERFGEVHSLLAEHNGSAGSGGVSSSTPPSSCEGCGTGCDPSGGGCCRVEATDCAPYEGADCGQRVGCPSECCEPAE